jgi:integrase/recombinase XerD
VHRLEVITVVTRRKNVLNDAELSIVRQKKHSYLETFKEALELFERDCDLRNLRPYTIKYYRNEISAFLTHLSEQGIYLTVLKPSDVTEEHINENVILYMRNYKGAKVVSINTRLRALRAFFNFLHKQKHIPKNPMENIKLLKDRKRVIPTFTKEQLNKLFRQPDLKTFTGVRDYTIMMLFLETGIRVNELTGLTLADVRWEDNRIRMPVLS